MLKDEPGFSLSLQGLGVQKSKPIRVTLGRDVTLGAVVCWGQPIAAFENQRLAPLPNAVTSDVKFAA